MILLISCIGIVAETDINPLTYMTTELDREIVLPLLCSLLNTVCTLGMPSLSSSAYNAFALGAQ